MPFGIGTLILAAPLADTDATLHRLALIEVLVAAGVLLSIALVGVILIRRGLRPLERIEEDAAAIGAGDLSRRVEPDDLETEVGRLGHALNAMLGQIEGAFAERAASEERLRRFVSDASHELRTPVAAVRAYAELFDRGARDRPDDLERSMRGIQREAVRIGVLVDDLLLLARLDQGRPLRARGAATSARSRATRSTPRACSTRTAPRAARRGRGAGGRRRAAAAPGGRQPARERPRPHAAGHAGPGRRAGDRRPRGARA